MEHDIRPWGEYWVLEDGETHKVKRILVNPGGRLSLQYHHHRAEVWTIVSGTGTITIGDEIKDFKTKELKHFENFKIYFKNNTNYIINTFTFNNKNYIKIIKQ